MLVFLAEARFDAVGEESVDLAAPDLDGPDLDAPVLDAPDLDPPDLDVADFVAAAFAAAAVACPCPIDRTISVDGPIGPFLNRFGTAERSGPCLTPLKSSDIAEHG